MSTTPENDKRHKEEILMTVRIDVRQLEGKLIPIQVDCSEPVGFNTLLTLFERLADQCRQNIQDNTLPNVVD